MFSFAIIFSFGENLGKKKILRETKLPCVLLRNSCFSAESVSLGEEAAQCELMSEDLRIHSWPCSYYLDSSKQWIPGKLSLTPLSIQFTAGRTGELLLDFHLSAISDIKKESSHLIFSSLTILEKGTKHWFSSLHPNRNVVFNILEHFWREQLLSRQEAGAGAALESSKGKELTGMLEGSQKRLEDTAKVLHSQGEQFDNIMRGLHKIEGDMDVADRYGMGMFPLVGLEFLGEIFGK